MTEEKEIKARLVLSPEEIDFIMGLTAETKADSDDRNLLSEQRELFMEKRFKEIWNNWQKRAWENALEGILEIPGDTKLDLLTMPDFYGKARVESIGRLSVAMLMKQSSTHLSVEQVKLVNAALRRINPNGKGLSDERWKKMFLEMANKFFPDNVKETAEAVAEAGIDKDEYAQAIWKHMIETIKGKKDLLERLEINSDFTEIVVYIDKCIYKNHGLQTHARELLQAGDTLLAQGIKNDSLLARKRLSAACQVYKTLLEDDFPINEPREKIIEIRDMCEDNRLSYNRMLKKIKRVMVKAGFDMEI